VGCGPKTQLVMGFGPSLRAFFSAIFQILMRQSPIILVGLRKRGRINFADPWLVPHRPVLGYDEPEQTACACAGTSRPLIQHSRAAPGLLASPFSAIGSAISPPPWRSSGLVLQADTSVLGNIAPRHRRNRRQHIGNASASPTHGIGGDRTGDTLGIIPAQVHEGLGHERS